MELLFPRFLVDENLRGLARWLRFLGFDAALAAGQTDRSLIVWCQAEGRFLLTRDRELAASIGSGQAMLLRSEKTSEQLQRTARPSRLAG